MKELALREIRIENFKAIQDSGPIHLGPLTAFIGYNGSGKSSVVEGLEMLRDVVVQDLDTAMQRWHGFEHIWNQHVGHGRREPTKKTERLHQENPMRFRLRGRAPRGAFRCQIAINMEPSGDRVFLQQERVTQSNRLETTRDALGNVTDHAAQPDGNRTRRVADGTSALSVELKRALGEWQFLGLIPQHMGEPVPQKRTGGGIQLHRTGSNIAEYLLDIRRHDAQNRSTYFEGILETLQTILEGTQDLQPVIASELERSVYLQMTEGTVKIPGWLLSTGTLRLLALLAVLQHPAPPPLIVIEEIENGLDPRAIHLVIDEIQAAVASGSTQVILTTHSPYLLDLLDLSHIILVERIGGQSVFSRPADEAALQEWAKRYGPGSLYTMSRLQRNAQR